MSAAVNQKRLNNNDDVGYFYTDRKSMLWISSSSQKPKPLRQWRQWQWQPWEVLCFF